MGKQRYEIAELADDQFDGVYKVTALYPDRAFKNAVASAEELAWAQTIAKLLSLQSAARQANKSLTIV